MKVGTDAVLLGAWVNVGDAKTILDVGTGSGVIALMLAQRSNGIVDAIEPDKNSSEQAKENFDLSPWKDRLHVFNTRIQEVNTAVYDLIVTNPPFFSNSLLPPKATRQNARHTETLSFDDLLIATKRLLTNHGRLAVVLPVTEGDHFREKALTYDLYCNRRLAFYSRRSKQQERWLMEFSWKSAGPVNETLVLYGEKENWSTEYAALVKEFLTKLSL
jgi:tRNA1Val (adenine37-N6)-methyltransferase